jgi:hypothetical protein
MSTLDTSPRLDDPDGLFEALVEAHRDLDAEASRRLNARLVLLLANHIGSVAIVREAIAAAREAAKEEP